MHEAMRRINIRRVLMAIESKIQRALEARFGAGEDSLAQIESTMREHLIGFESVGAIYPDSRVEARTEHIDWDDLYPTYGRKWLAMLADRLEYYGICKSFSGFTKNESLAVSKFRWYHFLLPYKRTCSTFIDWDDAELNWDDQEAIVQTAERNVTIETSATLIRPHSVAVADIYIRPMMAAEYITMNVTIDRSPL